MRHGHSTIPRALCSRADRRPIDDASHLACELIRGERLLEKLTLPLQHPAAQNVIIGVAGHEQKSDAWPRCDQLLDQLPPVHPGHHDIRYHCID